MKEENKNPLLQNTILNKKGKKKEYVEVAKERYD
jgi:hypothetical protein